MKKNLFIIIFIMLISCFGYVCVSAQTQKEISKEYKQKEKQARSRLKAKVSKDAKRMAKTLKKEGWTVTPGGLPLEKQLDKSYVMQYELDDAGNPQYIMGEGRSVGENYDAAKMQAMEIAKIQIAKQLEEEITAITENSLANQQLKAEEAASIMKSLVETRSFFSQNMGRVSPLVEVNRTLRNKNREVLVRLVYDNETAKDMAKNMIREDLKKESKELGDKLDAILGW